MQYSEPPVTVYDTNSDRLIHLIGILFRKWKILIKFWMIFVFVGVLISILLPDIYTSRTTFILQTGIPLNDSSTSLSGLASIAGFKIDDISQGEVNIPAELYPQIVGSIDFKLSLIEKSISISNEVLSIGEYLKAEYGIEESNPSSFLKPIEIQSIPNVNQKDDIELLEILDKTLVVNSNKREGFVTLQFSDYNKYAAAQIAQTAKNLLQQRIIDYKVQSASEFLNYVSIQFMENKKVYERLQDSLAVFKDQNLNISSLFYLNHVDRMERDLNLAYSVTEQLASQVEQAKLRVSRETPVFTVIDPVSIPYTPSSPKRLVIVLLFSIFGFFAVISSLVMVDPLREFVDSLKKNI